jgi:FeS assembly SUF system regulator
MLRISKLTDYATVILSYLALDPLRILSATLIAKEIHLSVPTVSKLLKILQEAELVKSYRGTGGGYQLARSAKDITLADIVTAIEGNLAMTECCTTNSLCAIDSLCTLKDNWKVINRIILNALARVTLQDMKSSMNEHPLTLQGIPIKVSVKM